MSASAKKSTRNAKAVLANVIYRDPFLESKLTNLRKFAANTAEHQQAIDDSCTRMAGPSVDSVIWTDLQDGMQLLHNTDGKVEPSRCDLLRGSAFGCLRRLSDAVHENVANGVPLQADAVECEAVLTIAQQWFGVAVAPLMAYIKKRATRDANRAKLRNLEVSSDAVREGPRGNRGRSRPPFIKPRRGSTWPSKAGAAQAAVREQKTHEPGTKSPETHASNGYAT